MRAVKFTKSLTAASANCIAQAQSLAANGNVTLNGGSVVAGVWTLDTQRRIAIVSSGNDSTITATINGFNDTHTARTEVLALTNGGTAGSVNDFLSGSTITLSGATAGTITIGTSGTASTDWFMPNFQMTPFSMNFDIEVTGTATPWNLETTNNRYWSVPPDATTNVIEVIQGSTISQQPTLSAPVSGWRATITAGTGTLSVQSYQAGITNIGR